MTTNKLEPISVAQLAALISHVQDNYEVNHFLVPKANMPDKLYPRHCGSCKQESVQPATKRYVSQKLHEGKTLQLVIHDLPYDLCSNCGQEVYTNVSSDSVESALQARIADDAASAEAGGIPLAEVYELLCTKDRRNPDFWSMYGEEDEPSRAECWCDACCYGRHRLAEEILRLRSLVQAEQQR